MSWQLWVLMALTAAGLVLLAAARMRHARKVFDDITELDHPKAERPAEPVPAGDDLARARARHLQTEAGDRHRKHG
jgi:DNA-binding IclR family transcriptional regulator